MNGEEYFIPTVKRMFKEPMIAAEGEGAIVRDSEGREYIDLMSEHGVNFIGHRNAEVVRAIKDQADKLIFMSTDIATAPALELAKRLAEIAKPLDRCYFLNAGAEAVECAIYLARKHKGRYEIMGLYGAFHGRTYGARSLVGWSGYKKGMGPYLPGVSLLPSYYCYRCSLGLEYPGCGLQCAKILEDAIKYQSSGDIAAFIAEPIQGTAGNIPAPDGYFREVKKILDANDILLIDDEVFTGFGRTGKIFCIEHHGVQPDIITCGKAMGGGMPISAVLTNENVARAFAVDAMMYFTTFGSHPISCAAALASINVILRDRFHERAARLGEYFMKRLRELAGKHELIGDVRGRGLMIGVELVKDRRTKEPAREESRRLREECRRRGAIVPAGQGWLGNVIRMYPPAAITEEQIDKSIEILDDSLKAIS
ncbi:MAG: aspartate aminotransferase family protein [Candidatus Bathyarchaeia archaeon]